MRIEEMKLDYSDVLIRPKRSELESRSQVELTRTFQFKYSKQKLDAVPLIASNMHGVGTFAMARALATKKAMVCLHKYYSAADLVKFFKSLSEEESKYVFYTIGASDTDLAKLEEVLKKVPSEKIKNICVDVANGYMEKFVRFVKKVRKQFPNKVLMAGNVVTGDMTEALSLCGVDIIKVGIGPGSVCITRKVTGVGYPQLSAVIECADAAHGVGTFICADGGCQVPGDVVKALGAGADFVMLGGMFAGHEESEAVVKKGKKKIVRYFGSSSEEAMVTYSGGMASYRAAEGKSVEVDYKGPIEKTLQEIMGGMRSGCTYVGAHKIKDLPKNTTFVRVGRQLNDLYKS